MMIRWDAKNGDRDQAMMKGFINEMHGIATQRNETDVIIIKA